MEEIVRRQSVEDELRSQVRQLKFSLDGAKDTNESLRREIRNRDEKIAILTEALKPFARYERVRIDPVIKTNGRSLVPKTGDIWVTCAEVDGQYTEAAITVEDMTKARELTGI